MDVDVRERRPTVHVPLTTTQLVQIRTVDDQHARHGRPLRSVQPLTGLKAKESVSTPMLAKMEKLWASPSASIGAEFTNT